VRQGETASEGSLDRQSARRRESAGAADPARSIVALRAQRRAAGRPVGRPSDDGMAAFHRAPGACPASRCRRTRADRRAGPGGGGSGGSGAYAAARGGRAPAGPGLAQRPRDAARRFRGRAIPAPAQAVIVSLRDRETSALESLADDFLRGAVASADVGAVLYVAAALQVYFTRLAAELPAASLRLLPQRGLAPAAGQRRSRASSARRARRLERAISIVRFAPRRGTMCGPSHQLR